MADLFNPLPLLNTHNPARNASVRDNAPSVPRRLTLLTLCFCLVMAIFAGRIYQLTVLDGPKYRETSDYNFLLEEPIIAPRGRILDCKGRPLAINQTLFDIQMCPFHMSKQEITKTIDRLATLLNRPQLRAKAQQVIDLRPKWKNMSLLDRKLLPLSDVLPVLEQASDLPGVIPMIQYQRYYPYGVLAGSITGHVGKYDKDQKDEYEAKGYLPDEKIGQLGAERTFEELIHGKHGKEMVKRDAQGRPRERYMQEGDACKPGAILTLSIDMDLQRLADQLLGSYRGAIVAMDPRDGSVLAMATHPNYDPNDPSGRNSAPGTVSSYNLVTRGTYAPGSTFKIVTAAAGLQAGYSPLEGISCSGHYYLPGTGLRFKCTWQHWDENLFEAMQHSCNVYFMTWTYRLRADRMIDMSHAFGFGERTGFDLVAPEQESPGIAGRKDRLYLGNVVQMGIGQGELINVTPIQLARAYAALANGGTLYRPHILKEAHMPDGTPMETNKAAQAAGKPEVQGKLPLTDHQRGLILEGLRRVVNETGGTAARYGIKPEWRVCGKTGTAQIGGGKTNAWFVGFAPAEAPSILVVVLVERSPWHGGEMCAPIARQLLAYYFGQPEPALMPAGSEPPKKSSDSVD